MPKAMKDMTAQELLDERNNAVHSMKTIKAKADGEKRDFTPQEDSEYDDWMKKYNDYDSAYKGKKKSDDRSKFLEEREKESEDASSQRRTRSGFREEVEQERRNAKWTPIKDYDSSCKFHRYNQREMQYSPIRGNDEYSKAFKQYLKTGDWDSFKKFQSGDYRPEGTDLSYQQSDDDVRGGYTVPSETFMEGLLREVDDQTWIWKNSRVIVVSQAQALGIRKLTSKMSCWAKGAELSNAFDNEDDSIRYGKKNLTPSYFTGAARISRDLLRVSVIDPEALVYSEFARDLGYVIEQEDISGDGVGGPLGVLVNSSDGISSSRDYSTDTTSSAFKVETLIGAKYTLKPQYRNRARWMFHRNRIAALMKLRSDSGAGAGTGDFLWQPAVRAGEPDTICGLPIDENEFFPSGTGSGVYFGMLACWEYYIHAIGLDMEILRLVETRAARNQVEYVGRVKIDGMPVLEEAFVRLKFA